MPGFARRSASLLVLLWCLALPGAAVDGSSEPGAPFERYLAAWRAFYPSQALSRGFVDAIGGLEDYSAGSIVGWFELNAALLEELDALGELPLDERIDRRLLRTQILRELDRWGNDRPHETSLGLYAEHLDGGLDALLDSTALSRDEKRRLAAESLDGMARLAHAARENLVDGSRPEFERALERLDRGARSIGPRIDAFTAGDGPAAAELQPRARATVAAIEALAEHVRSELLERLTLTDEPILGRDAYAEKLAIYTDSDLTPERLEKLALDEIEASRKALAEMAEAYRRATYPDEPPPGDPAAAIARAFADLEANRPLAEQPYLERLRQYRRDVESFVREREIATVPEHNTLSVELAPESAGPMARIGYVSAAPPFHPNPWTTWYLATIPDSHPEQERVDFWRSFNYSFKRFIVIHELFPGHYMQLKILREHPHRVRVLFPYRPFIEGWATFTERIVLDAGYAEGDWLTRLAQLRKRLENANRAYTSVQAHCNGWSEQQVFDFSVETSLLAPQFAKSLWGRLMRSPMQILTYMLMGLELRDLYEAERERLGDRFVLRDFMDTILRTGPVPTDELGAVLAAEHP